MNAKKIMGAVLVALLAAALFVGAGAAAGTSAGPVDGDIVFVNQKLHGDFAGNWISGNNVAITTAVPDNSGYVYFAGPVVDGAYTKKVNNVETTIIIKNKPTVTITGTANTGAAAYNFIGGVLYKGAHPVTVSATEQGYDLYFTYANKTEVKLNAAGISSFLQNEDPAVGEYSIRAVYSDALFVPGTLASTLITDAVTFKVAKSGDVTIATSVDQALRGEGFKVTITGEPGVEYQVNYGLGDFDFAQNQIAFAGVQVSTSQSTDDFLINFEMPNTGSVEFTLVATTNAEESEKIAVSQFDPVNTDNKASVTVKFTKGNIYDVKTDAPSYFVGDKVEISGVSTAGEIVSMKITGTNFEAPVAVPADIVYGTETAMTFEFEIATAGILNQKDGFQNKKLDVGTYTLTIKTASAEATVPIVLKQPFISIVEAPEVIIQDTEAEFIINAEATTNGIAYYIFGTNFFKNGAGVQDDDIETQYTVKLDKATTKNMSAGQYFAVFQHPMYDGAYNVSVKVANSWIIESTNGVKIDVKERQTANAAQALCDELDAQNIDDMYAKASFFVVGEDESFTISDIPATIAKGETLTISGVSTANADKYVTVEMISTAFAAVPKETVGSAAFIAVTTQIAEDGTWEVTFDTSDLNVDEYSLKVACSGEDKPWKNVNIDVVEAADKPDTPVTPPADDEPGQDEPVAPETPGFGALAALAGLGAVAVLLLRRE